MQLLSIACAVCALNQYESGKLTGIMRLTLLDGALCPQSGEVCRQNFNRKREATS